MRRSFAYCTLDPHYRAKYFIGVFAAVAYTIAAALVIALVSSAPSKAADPYDQFDAAIASWNKACHHQVWPDLDSQCMKGADVGAVRVIGGPQIPFEVYRDAERLLDPPTSAACWMARKSCVSANSKA